MKLKLQCLFASTCNKLTVLLLCISGLQAQNLKLEYDSAKVNIQKNKFAEAIPWLEKARISASEPKMDSANYAEIIRLLAVSYAKLNKNNEANTYFVNALEFLEKMPLKKAAYGSLMQNYGVFLFNQKKYAEAEIPFKKALSIKQQTYEKKTPEMISILQNLATCLVQQRKWSDAEPVLNELFELRKTLPQPIQTDYWLTISQLSTVYKNLQHLAKNLSLLTSVVDLVQSQKGVDSKDFAWANYMLATAYQSLEQAENMHLYAQIAVQTYEKLNLTSTPEYIQALSVKAASLRLLQKYMSAENTLKIVLSLSQDQEMQSALHYEICLIQLEYGNLNAAEQTGHTYLEWAKKKGEKHPEVAKAYLLLSKVNLLMGKPDVAEYFMQKCIKIRKEVIGEKQRETLEAQLEWAKMLIQNQRYEEAKTICESLVPLSKAYYGETSKEYLQTIQTWISALINLNKGAQAELILKNYISTVKNTRGQASVEYQSLLVDLAMAQHKIGKKVESKLLIQQQIDWLKGNHGERNAAYAQLMKKYLIFLYQNAAYTEADLQAGKVVALYKDLYGERHKQYIDAVQLQACIQTQLIKFTSADLLWATVADMHLARAQFFYFSLAESSKLELLNQLQLLSDQLVSYMALRPSETLALQVKLWSIKAFIDEAHKDNAPKWYAMAQTDGSTGFRDLYAKVWQARESQSAYFSLPKYDAKVFSEAEKQIASLTNLEAQLNTLVELPVQDHKIPTWQEVQKKLTPNQAWVQISRHVKFAFDSGGRYQPDSINYLHFIVHSDSKNGPIVFIQNNGAQLEKQHIRYYRNAIRTRSEDALSYKAFWEPIRQKLADRKEVFMAVSGVYEAVNVLTLKNTKTNTYLFDEIDITRFLCAKDFLQFAKNNKTSKAIALIGGADFQLNTRNIQQRVPGTSLEIALNLERTAATVLPALVGSKIEIENIVGLLKPMQWSAELNTEQNATEDKLPLYSKDGILHISTVAFFENKKDTKFNFQPISPLYVNGLYLAGAAFQLAKRNIAPELRLPGITYDGVVYCSELNSVLTKSADVLVLSGIDLGLGEQKNGEGLSVLLKSLNTSGNTSILHSIWAPSDVYAQRFLQIWYETYARTRDKKQAYKQAITQLKSDYVDPYFWGAYVLTGH